MRYYFVPRKFKFKSKREYINKMDMWSVVCVNFFYIWLYLVTRVYLNSEKMMYCLYCATTAYIFYRFSQRNALEQAQLQMRINKSSLRKGVIEWTNCCKIIINWKVATINRFGWRRKYATKCSIHATDFQVGG